MWRDMYDVKELAKELGYSPQNVTRLVRAGKITFVKRGRKYYFPKSVLEEIIKTSEGLT